MAHRRKSKDIVKQRRTAARVARLIRQRRALREALSQSTELWPKITVSDEGKILPPDIEGKTAVMPADARIVPVAHVSDRALDKIIFAVERA